MSNIIVEGFAHYGLGSLGGGSSAVALALLSGTYAQVSTGVSSLNQLPWDPSNTDIYYSNQSAGELRRVLPSTEDPLVVSMYYACSVLPSRNDNTVIAFFRDGSNVTIAKLILQSTGALAVYDKNDVLLSQTSGPVIVAETATHLEMKLTVSGGSFKLNVNEVTVINVSGLTYTGSGNCAQVAFLNQALADACIQYIANLIMRNNAGGVNNDITGDRRVATLFVNADDVAHQGWTPEPRHKFGNGILDNRNANNSGYTAANSSQTDLGSGDFTIETWVRFFALPSGANKAVIFGKWDETNNKRSYQLYMGGPSLEGGNTVFRISTDGGAGTVSELISWPWTPLTNEWHHVAVSRASAETLLFIDGIQQGLQVADSNTYYAGTETTAVGVQDDSGSQIANTAFNGFMDETRLSVGYARYTASFMAPVAAFPRGSGLDAHWSSVALLAGYDTGVFDESGFLRTLTAQHGSVAITPNDGTGNYQCLNKPTPFDDTFIEAALTPAFSILTQTSVPTNNKTVTVGTTDGSTPAVYTWKTTLTGAAFEVKIAVSAALSLANLIAAINAAAGTGTTYGTGTTANHDVSAAALPGNQIEVTAVAPGSAGNAIATATNDAAGSWTSTTLAGGADIPGYSNFYIQRPPNQTTLIDSLTIVHRDFKTDAGTATVRALFVGVGGGVAAGAANPLTTVPTYYQDLIETDPDTSGNITPTTVVEGRVRLTRTA